MVEGLYTFLKIDLLFWPKMDQNNRFDSATKLELQRWPLFMILLKPHVWENVNLELHAKVLSANQISGFLNFIISKTIGGKKLILCWQLHIY